ncbi:MAG: phytochelatin synthase family protein [Desulfotignum sp.]|nr:phytochelatin synthase family protein [Desulfotignum sp.]
MKLIFILMRTILYFRYFFHKLTGTGSFGRDPARYETTLPKIEGNPVKEALFRHHVRQFHESSCSVASVACVVNALLEHQGRMTETPVTQQDLLDRVTAANWKERMGPNGYRGRRGLPLPVLGNVVAASLEVFNISHHGIEVVPATRNPVDAAAFCRTLKSRLNRFERTGDSIIIAHFDQGSLVRDLNIPHISPVGGFDPDTGDVTILDVDSFQPYPYTVSFNRFYQAISTNYLHLFRMFGYGRGGYVYIRNV